MYCIIIQVEDTPLIYACRAGHSDVVTVLINDGANPNATNRVSILNIIMLLVYNRAIIQSGLTPLMCAIESRSVKAVKTLLSGGAATHPVEPVKLTCL